MALEKFPTIRLQKGATSILGIDLTEFDFQGGTVVFTVQKSYCNEIVKEWEFSTPEVHAIVFEDDFTSTLKTGNKSYEYGITWRVDGERFSQCAPSNIEVGKTVGGFPHGTSNE